MYTTRQWVDEWCIVGWTRVAGFVARDATRGHHRAMVGLCAVLLPKCLEFSLGLFVLALVENHDDMVEVKRF